MDIALCKLDVKKKIVEYSGAYNPLIHISGDTVNHIKADHQPVALYSGKMKPFSNHVINVKEGDMLYLASDGFSDQFGGEKGKKYMASKFKKFLLSISTLSCQEQKQALKKELNDWKGKLEQIDDICIMGVKI